MSMISDRDPLDQMLRQHLAEQLDRQTGRAEAAFLRHLQAAPAKRPTYWTGQRLSAWALGISGSLLAASIALFALMPMIRGTGNSMPIGQPGSQVTDVGSSGPIAQGPNSGQGIENEPLRVRQVTSRMVDDGTVVAEQNVPVRRYRLQKLEERLYYDARTGVTIKVIVPSEEVTDVEMPRY